MAVSVWRNDRIGFSKKYSRVLWLVGSTLAFLLLSILLNDHLFARAGGAGGGSDYGGGYGGSGSGDGDDVFYIVYSILRIVPFPYNFIVLGIGGYIYIKLKMQESVLNQIPRNMTMAPPVSKKAYEQFKKSNPSFHEEEFLSYVRKAFTDIQAAWSRGDISPVRAMISDGVYQRFHTQLKMMELLKQSNKLEGIDNLFISVVKYRRSGKYDVVDLAIQATINDNFVSELDDRLNSGGAENFMEYWSFIRLHNENSSEHGQGKFTYDFSPRKCPACGAELEEDMVEVARCKYCQTLLNSGSYHWVLAEITQPLDYAATLTKTYRGADASPMLERKTEGRENFSTQDIEDKASNGYLQLLSSISFNQPGMIRRFVSDQFFEKFKRNYTGDTLAFNRIFLNDVTVLARMEKTEEGQPPREVVMTAVKSTYQRVKKIQGGVEFIDKGLQTKTEVVFMERDLEVAEAKGSVYSHQCTACGAPVKDSTEYRCSYCNETLNATSRDWIITDLQSMDQFFLFYEQNLSAIDYKMRPGNLDKILDNRDYAFNNILVMLAVDGNISNEEVGYIHKLAKSWGYSFPKLTGMLQQARAGNLSLVMPENRDSRKKIIHRMEKAARADNEFSEAEKEFLDHVRREYLTGQDAA